MKPEKVDYEREGKQGKNLMLLSEQYLELVRVCKEAIRNLKFLSFSRLRTPEPVGRLLLMLM
jgi:hypothetical protein